MSVTIINNFKISNATFLYNDVAKTKWLNDGSVPDIQMTLSDKVFPGYENSLQEQIATVWENLKNRSRTELSEGSVFTFYNSEILKWEGIEKDENGGLVASVSKGLFYRDVAAVRSHQELFDAIEEKPSAFVLINILITADNKIVLGRRDYYGDWPNGTYECPGSFLKEKNIAAGSLVEIAKQKVRDDYVDGGEISSIPFIIFDLPRVMETMLLCVSKTSLTAAQMKSDFYTDILIIDNSLVGKTQLQKMSLDLFHPPSRVALQVYFEHFDLVQQSLS